MWRMWCVRERESVCAHVCVCEREGVCVCACVRESGCVRVSEMCVCVVFARVWSGVCGVCVHECVEWVCERVGVERMCVVRESGCVRGVCVCVCV